MRSLITGLLPKFLGLMFIGLLCLSVNASEARADATWKNLRGHSACGAIDQYGKLQPPCGFKKATYIKKAIKSCPKGTFAGAGACYTCPTGFNRNISRKVTHEKACRKAISAKTAAASRIGSANCPSGSKFDPRNGGECWSCPSGFGRTAAKVDKWNACGKVGKKAQSAIFKGRSCPVAGSIRDPRKGGECWKCPEGYSRTGNSVTGARACKISFAFASAVQKSDKKCGPGEIHDLIDGGTCWTCPDQAKRTTFFGIKSAKACRNTKMQWVVPNRQKYGLFSLGTGADDILAQLISDRTRIDESIKAAATEAGVSTQALLEKEWAVIDTQPWNNPYLSALLGMVTMEAATKPASQRTAAEKGLVDRVEQLIQWNQQFIAYQAKQAYDTHGLAAKKSRDEAMSKSGAAVIYAGGAETPPNYNDLIVASVQAGAGVAGPLGAISLVSIKSVSMTLRPFGMVARQAAAKALQQYGQAAVQAGAGGMSMSTTVAAAAAGPLIIATAAGVIVTMEMDKLIAKARVEGGIRQAIDQANRPVDLKVFLQKKDGPDSFLFHWASVIGAETRPSANFKTRLAAYKDGTDPAASATLSLPNFEQPTMDIAPATPSTPVTTSTTELSGEPKTEAKPLTAEQKAQIAHRRMTAAIKQAVQDQSKRRLFPNATRGVGGKKSTALRIELSNRAGNCLSKKSGRELDMSINGCKHGATLWITPDSAHKTLVFAEKYCLSMAKSGTKSRSPKRLIVETCNDKPTQKFELTSEGFIKQVNTNQCVTVVGKRTQSIVLTSKDCGSDRPSQIWRPWAGR